MDPYDCLLIMSVFATPMSGFSAYCIDDVGHNFKPQKNNVRRKLGKKLANELAKTSKNVLVIFFVFLL